MASALDVKRLGLGVAAALLMAALVWFGTGLDPFWPLMWFAPLPVLLFANRAAWWSSALVAALGVMLGLLNLWHVFHGLLGAPLPVLAQIYLSEGIVYALAVSLYRALLQRGAYWAALLAFPAVIVCFEFFLDLTSPHGTSGSLAYSQLQFLPFLQLASVTGPWGMSFLLLAFSTALAVGLHVYPEAPKRALRLTGGVVALLVLVLACGAWRLHEPVQGTHVKVGLVSSDAGANDDVADPGQPAARLFQDYSVPVEQLAAQGARVVVLPEKLAVVLDGQTADATDGYFQKLVDRTGAAVVVGVIRVAKDGKKYNEARVYMAGRPPMSYDKQHMLPPFESMLTPGTSLTLLPRADAMWGVEICKDMDFSALSADYGKKGVSLMLVPGWDFVADRIFHGHMAIMRGVESGFSIVRSAKQGSLYVSDDRGRVLAEITSNSAPFVTLMARVPAVHHDTFYMVAGDWFAWISLLLLLGTLGWLIWIRKTPARR
ncbi:MAG TPA: nitrilase-related carbon-nitrogen hydrolase [Gammaproteobacteria bacterium]|jgi:apolipoprotein N-acyltransferase